MVSLLLDIFAKVRCSRLSYPIVRNKGLATNPLMLPHPLGQSAEIAQMQQLLQAMNTPNRRASRQ